ncbi:acyl-CoA dehydrogenase [Pseudolysinimonas sp.]|uniref:acyl-CoA dehydrogenase n=1 Tax=Pseudolysinimonas sp. TaxID=2680009 RepID=UPI003783AF27
MLVRLSSAVPAGSLVHALPAELPRSIDAGLELARDLGGRSEGPGDGATTDLWEALATVAATDLGAARVVEPHLDAVAILRQAGESRPVGAWGVFAAEGGDAPLIATAEAAGVTLTGTKPWCSLADRLDGALVTAASADGTRGLYAVSLRDPGVEVIPGAWHARGLSELPSGPVRFADVAATPVGEPGWYLTRPGFEWGGIGVAACWFGGAVGIARAVHAAARARPNPFLLMHLGAIDRGLADARRALAEAASLVDARRGGERILAKRVRATVAAVAEDVIARAGHALGPAPLALDAEHAKRVADLTLYIRQHHAERDLESLGSALAEESTPW